MKNRSVAYVGDRTVSTFQGSVLTVSTTRRTATVDALTVQQDYTGPVQRHIVHAHEFTKTQYNAEWIGSFTEIVNPTNFTEVRGVSAIGYNVSHKLSLSLSDSLYNEALSELYDAIRGQVDVAVTAAEASSTMQMKRQLERQTWKAFTAIGRFKRSIGKAFNRAPDIGSNAWLTWTYGIQPLIRDVYNTADNLRRALPEDMVVRVRKSSSESLSWKAPLVNAPYLAPGVHAETVRHRVLIEARFKIPDSVLAAAGNWTSLNPVSIGWELLPYSFVVDWFVDVGGYLRNLESAALYASAFRGGFVVRGFKGTMDSVCDGFSTSNGRKYTANLRASRVTSKKHRYPLTVSPRPRTPGFKVDLGWKRLVSAASLIYQAGGKPARR